MHASHRARHRSRHLSLLACFVLLGAVAAGCGEPGAGVFTDVGGQGAGGSDGQGGAVGAGGSDGGHAGSGAGGQGGQGGEGGSGGRGYTGPNTVVTNNDQTCNESSFWAGPGKENHLVAARLTPPSYPFVVEFVRYTLWAYGSSCHTGLAHDVDVFVGSDIAPPPTPAVAAHFDVPVTSDTDTDKVMLHELSAPLTVQQGEHIFVAVRLTATTSGPLLCVKACGGPAYQQDRNYRSNAVAPPYQWSMLGLYSVNFDFEAIGHPP